MWPPMHSLLSWELIALLAAAAAVLPVKNPRNPKIEAKLPKIGPQIPRLSELDPRVLVICGTTLESLSFDLGISRYSYG